LSQKQNEALQRRGKPRVGRETVFVLIVEQLEVRSNDFSVRCAISSLSSSSSMDVCRGDFAKESQSNATLRFLAGKQVLLGRLHSDGGYVPRGRFPTKNIENAKRIERLFGSGSASPAPIFAPFSSPSGSRLLQEGRSGLALNVTRLFDAGDSDREGRNC